MSSLSGNSCWVTSWLRLDTGSSSLLPCFWILRHTCDIYILHRYYDYICCSPESILESQGTGFVEACLVRRRGGVEEGVVGSGQYRDVGGVPLRERHGHWSLVSLNIADIDIYSELWRWTMVGVRLYYTVWSRHLNIDDTTHHQLVGNVCGCNIP